MKRSLDALIDLAPADKKGAYVSLLALNALDSIGRKALPVKDALKAMTLEDKSAPATMRQDGGKIFRKINAEY